MVVLKGEKYQKKMKEQNICSNNNGLLDKLATDVKGKVLRLINKRVPI